MTLTIIALGSRGDVQPYVALGRGLHDAGYPVRMVTFASFESMVKGQGLDFHPVQGDAQAIFQTAAQNNMMGTRNPFKMMRATMRSYGQMIEDYITAFSSDALSDSSAILNQLPGSLFGVDLAEKLGVPHIILSVIPLTPTRAFASPLLTSRSAGGLLNEQSYYFSGQLLWAFFRPKIAQFRRRLGLTTPPSRLFKFLDHPTINGFSQHVVQRPADWGAHVHVTGYWTLNESAWQPPAELVQFLEAGPPPIFIGFGSMIAPDPDAMTRTLLEAITRSGQRAIIGKGWAKIGSQPMPDHVFTLDYAPYEWLFPRMSAVIHHGGSGTTGFALRSGSPSMVVAFGADQLYWGKRAEAVGAALPPIPVKQLTVDNLTDSIRLLTGSEALKQGARRMRELLLAEDGIGKAVRLIGDVVKS